MKLAPVGFSVALGIFLSAIALSHRGNDDAMKQVSLDFTGIDTLEIRANQNTTITIQDDMGPSMSYSMFTDQTTGEAPKVEVVRKNNILSIKANLHGYQGFDIRVPSSVRNMMLSQASISTPNNLQSMNIDVLQDSLSWSGNVKSLNIRSMDDVQSCKERYCQNSIHIEGGLIDLLTISATQGEVAFDRAKEIKTARLLLGPDVRLSLSNASSLKNIQFEEYAVKPAVEVVPEQ